jgi:ABC-type cobalamin/Fe3+-siderophores transport system ATPase subunit
MMALLAEVKPNKRKKLLLQASSASLKMMRKRKKIKEIESRIARMRDVICAHLAILLRQKSDELTISVKDLTVLTHSFQHENRSRLDSLALQVQGLLDRKEWGNGNLGEFSKLATQLRVFLEEAAENKKVIRILKSLHFKQIKERHSEIRDAHRETLEWVFDLSSGVNFTAWLSSFDVSNGIYWITGKAGSGKSTLMKFIQNHPQTHELLLQGAPGHHIMIATHYFWSAGTSLQKSQVGLFRTLLFQILSQAPAMVPLVVPDRWGSPFASLESWSRSELLTAFQQLAGLQLQEKLKICIFVDGLDEYCGDHRELADVFGLLSQSPHLKLCLSSRPWQDFIDAFGKSKWTLRVEQLTKEDIKLYIKDNLEQDARFLDLRRRDQDGADQLAQQIQVNSQGVFLWVYLVIRSLLRGLANGDEMKDLHRRLNELPTELEKYFELMLDTIEPIYRRQTAHIFRVMLSALHNLPIVSFHFLSHAQSGSFSQPWSPETIGKIIDQQRRQLSGSCKDLLYITGDAEDDPFSDVRVGFLHRTVSDFLRTSVMEHLLDKRSEAGFNPNFSLCKAHWDMYQVRLYPTDGSIRSLYRREELIVGTFHYARQVERHSERPVATVLDQMNAQISSATWSELLIDTDCKSFLDVAVRFDLQLYVTARIRQLQAESRSPSVDGQIASMLRQALKAELLAEQDGFFVFVMTGSIGLSMLQCLLENGADPNAKLDKTTELPPVTRVYDQIQETHGYAGYWSERVKWLNRSVWADFLLNTQLSAAAMREKEKNSEIDLPRGGRRGSLGHAYEACELLISYGANRNYHRKQRPIPKGGQEYYQAENALQYIFEDDAAPLLRLLDKMQPKEEKRSGPSCVLM